MTPLPEAQEFLRLLRKGPVPHSEAARRFGPYALGAYKRMIAGQGHIISTVHKQWGTVYELSFDAADQQTFEETAG